MKKVLLTAVAIFSLAASSAFGMYGYTSDWMDFLVDGNKFKARMDQLGFTLGNGTIKGTFGFRANKGAMGSILNTDNGYTTQLDATVSAGIGYTSEMIGVGLGYNFTYIAKNMYIHTPVLALNALNNNFRLVAPIQVLVSDNPYGGNSDTVKQKYTGVGFDGIQLRYYTGIDAFNAIRFYAFYRNITSEYTFGQDSSKTVSEALGFQLRLYFLNTQVGDVTVNPYIRLEYHTILKGEGGLGKYGAYVGDANGLDTTSKQSDIYDVSPYKVAIKPVLSLAANSDYVSLYFEPSLGYTMVSDKRVGVAQSTTHALSWGAYAELYVTPVKDLEWYFEMDVNGDVTGSYRGGPSANSGLSPVLFETTTGITWYLPSLGGDTAQ